MIHCETVRRSLEAWSDPGGLVLSDAVVDHLDACPDCRAVFDAAHPPVALASIDDAPIAALRVPRQGPRTVVWAAAGVAAAVAWLALTAVPSDGSVVLAQVDHELESAECGPAWPLDAVCDVDG